MRFIRRLYAVIFITALAAGLSGCMFPPLGGPGGGGPGGGGPGGGPMQLGSP